jgi:hypothetical protein
MGSPSRVDHSTRHDRLPGPSSGFCGQRWTSPSALSGVTDQAVAKWEKARQRRVANKAAERLLRMFYSKDIGAGEVTSLLDIITRLDAGLAEIELHLKKGAESGWAKAA